MVGLDERADGVAVTLQGAGLVRVRLDRAPGNRFDLGVLRRLEAITAAVRSDPDVRAVWLSAAGPDFSQGADLRDPELVRRIGMGRTAIEEVAQLGQRVIEAWTALPVPVVVSARGAIVGAGAVLVLASGFRVVDGDARLTLPEVARGMYLSWGALPLLAREVGLPIARSLALAGETWRCADLPPGAVRLAGDQDVDAAAGLLADQLCALPPLAVRSVHRTLQRVAAGDMSASDGDAVRFADTVLSHDFREAIAAWMQKRPGVYKGR